MTACALSIDDDRFGWDTHFGGSLDLVDYVVGRGGIVADYEAVLGTEFRLFDPNQGNYILEAFLSVRTSPKTEIMPMFHHVSRHLSDRAKRIPIAWNLLGARVLHHTTVRAMTVDLDFEGGRTTERANVDYTWIGEAHAQLRAPINSRVSVFARAAGQLFGVDDTMFGRGHQTGAFAEGGLRLHGPGGTMELFLGIERRVDADAIDLQTRNWVLAGFRLLSR